MKGLIGYTVLFMPIFLQCINGMKNLLIGKGKLINPLYDSEEKRKYLLFRAIVELVICAGFMAILFWSNILKVQYPNCLKKIYR